ncbi:hypothetical protein DND132_2467 [Pseudodesulfovibrio mercurii]|uniref:Uncharacterized protein n=1 Tax=Pseudodesulfovibrio mercurii TaxID=641491 RepID=F0JCJ0_9BACT|nr:hypothetical protein [Pseudodesulfovibrio mercurii]EGB15670.1 hypothetical protein DND132_2467 [Pseudodesulfovibrio mercurii]
MKALTILAVSLSLLLGLVVVHEGREEDAGVLRSARLLDAQARTSDEVAEGIERLDLLRRELDGRMTDLKQGRKAVSDVGELRCQLVGEVRHLIAALDPPRPEGSPGAKWLPFWMDAAKRERTAKYAAAARRRLRINAELREHLSGLLDRLAAREGREDRVAARRGRQP